MEIVQAQPAKRTRRAFSTVERGSRKDITKENVQLQPAKRTNRAFSSIERGKQLKELQPGKFSNASSQTDKCLAATNAKLTQELIANNDLLQKKDQNYIEILQKYYFEREKLTTENREKSLEIAQLKEQIERLQNEPLVDVENGKTSIN